jgi:hypothetical protein
MIIPSPEGRMAGHIFNWTDLSWNGNEVRCSQAEDRKLCSVVKDETYGGMWRVRAPDGRLSDMVNLSRAREASRLHSLTILNR